MIKTITETPNKIIAVELPKGANSIEIDETQTGLAYFLGEPSFKNIREIQLPQGKWEIMGTVISLTDEQICEIIGVKDKGKALLGWELRISDNRLNNEDLILKCINEQ